jgi:hypothetical protein
MVFLEKGGGAKIAAKIAGRITYLPLSCQLGEAP